MRRDLIATITSTALLAAAVVTWRELFFFSKAVHLPTWTTNLPSPIDTPRYLAFLCLLPAALFASTLSAAIRAIAWAVLLAPLPALVAYLASGSATGPDRWLNAAFNYAWVIGFNCLVSALILVAARALVLAAKRCIGG